MNKVNYSRLEASWLESVVRIVVFTILPLLMLSNLEKKCINTQRDLIRNVGFTESYQTVAVKPVMEHLRRNIIFLERMFVCLRIVKFTLYLFEPLKDYSRKSPFLAVYIMAMQGKKGRTRELKQR